MNTLRHTRDKWDNKDNTTSKERLQAATLELLMVPLPRFELLPAQPDQEGESDSTRRTVSALNKGPDVALPPWNYYMNSLAILWLSAACEQLDVLQSAIKNPPAESLRKKNRPPPVALAGLLTVD